MWPPKFFSLLESISLWLMEEIRLCDHLELELVLSNNLCSEEEHKEKVLLAGNFGIKL